MNSGIVKLYLCAGLLLLTVATAAAGVLTLAAPTRPELSRDGSVAALSNQLQPPVAIHRVTDLQTPSLSNDTYIDEQWALGRIHVPATWATKPQKDAVVAILDTGIDSCHEDLIGSVIKSINLTTSPTAEDVYGHGTHVAGIIAARTNNGLGIAGATQNVRLLNVKIADDNGDCNSVNVANGIIWAADHGANVINLSLAITRPSAGLEPAVDYAWGKGAVVVAAAGNSGKLAVTYPALYQNCIAVVATNEKDQVMTGLAGKEAIAAPGYNIFSSLPGNKYGYKSGSSMAAAYVSAAAALAFSAAKSGNSNLNNIAREQVWSGTEPIVSGMLNYRYINFERLAAAVGNN